VPYHDYPSSEDISYPEYPDVVSRNPSSLRSDFSTDQGFDWNKLIRGISGGVGGENVFGDLQKRPSISSDRSNLQDFNSYFSPQPVSSPTFSPQMQSFIQFLAFLQRLGPTLLGGSQYGRSF